MTAAAPAAAPPNRKSVSMFAFGNPSAGSPTLLIVSFRPYRSLSPSERVGFRENPVADSLQSVSFGIDGHSAEVKGPSRAWP